MRLALLLTAACGTTVGDVSQPFAPEGTPYAHLDIAGPAYNPGKPCASVPHGGTGYGVATLVELLD